MALFKPRDNLESGDYYLHFSDKNAEAQKG